MFFIKSQFRMCSKFPPHESMDAWTSLIMDGRTISRVPGRLRMVWQTSKRLGEVAVHCQLELNSLGRFQVSPEIKIVSAWCRTNVRVIPRKLILVDKYWHELFPCFGVGNSLLKFVQAVLDTPFMHSCGSCPESV